MKITVLETEQAFFERVAWEIAVEMVRKPASLIGLSTGRTTGGIHAALAEIYKSHPFDTSAVGIFGVDEITGISREYFGSCYYMLLHEVVKPLNIPLEHYIMPPTHSDDFARECRAFENALAQWGDGKVDLQILGIGENGHLGFNQPGSAFGSTTWVSRMDEALDERIRRETGSSPEADLGGLTLGIKNLMQSRRIILAANGPRKAQIIRDAILGPVTESVPASVLQLHPCCEVILDAPAAKLLNG